VLRSIVDEALVLDLGTLSRVSFLAYHPPTLVEPKTLTELAKIS